VGNICQFPFRVAVYTGNPSIDPLLGGPRGPLDSTISLNMHTKKLSLAKPEAAVQTEQ